MNFDSDYRTFHLESEAGPQYSPKKFAGSFFGGHRGSTGMGARTPASRKSPDVGFYRGAIWACVLSAPVWILVAIFIFKK